MRHDIRHTEAAAGRRHRPYVPNERLRYILIGYARVSKADGSQSLDLQRDALRRMGINGEFNFRGRNPVKIRCCQYLNNVREQDHRRVKGRLRPMLGLKTFYNARRVIIGIELAQKIQKRQFAIPITLQSNPAVTWRHGMAA